MRAQRAFRSRPWQVQHSVSWPSGDIGNASTQGDQNPENQRKEPPRDVSFRQGSSRCQDLSALASSENKRGNEGDERAQKHGAERDHKAIAETQAVHAFQEQAKDEHGGGVDGQIRGPRRL